VETSSESVGFHVSVGEIPYQRAHAAYSGVSFDPEERAAQVQKSYADHLRDVSTDLFSRVIGDEEKEGLCLELMEDYRRGYRKRYLAYLDAKSRTLSWMITGRSNFPLARNRKAMNVEDKRLKELFDWSRRAYGRIRNTLNPRSISSDRPDAVILLEQKIEAAEHRQVRMKAANKIVKKKGLSDVARIARLVSELKYSESSAKRLLEKDFAGRIGYPSYELTNNNANIRRMKDRVKQLEGEQARPTIEREVITPEGLKVLVTDNAEDNRVQLEFDGKPLADIRKKLKANGFKWARSIGVWQRLRNNSARWAAGEVLDVKIDWVVSKADRGEVDESDDVGDDAPVPVIIKGEGEAEMKQ